MGRIRGFGAFWYDFVVGDDWRNAVAVVLALLVTYVVAEAGFPEWWIVPLAVAVILPVSVLRAARQK
jgi:hypothetical protein